MRRNLLDRFVVNERKRGMEKTRMNTRKEKRRKWTRKKRQMRGRCGLLSPLLQNTKTSFCIMYLAFLFL